jgi:hypothetical protein
MSLESERILARYKQIEREPDVLGRVIGVRRLRPSEVTRVNEMTPTLTGAEAVDDGDGKSIEVSHRLPLLIAASVREIQDEGETAHIPFPRNRGELNAIFDRLDNEGLAAASTAFARLFPQSSGDEPARDPKAEAKNS